MKNYRIGFIALLLCLLVTPLFSPVAYSVALAPGDEGDAKASSVAAVSELKTMSQLLEMIYDNLPGALQAGTDASESSYKVLLSASGTVVTLSPPDYLRGVVAAEMSLYYDDEALKAQIVAAHTYALSYKIRQRTSPSESLLGADISDDPAIGQAYITDEKIAERYKDSTAEVVKKLDRLIAEVGNYILVYEEEPIVAAYHAISAGVTESAQNAWGAFSPYLVSVDSPGDIGAPGYLSTVALEKSAVEARLAELGASLSSDPSKWFDSLLFTSAGYVSLGKFGDCQLSGAKLREIFGLRSPCFSVSYSDGIFTFNVKGWGHGVGMSQYGAQALALEGKDYVKILQTYFTGSQLCRF